MTTSTTIPMIDYDAERFLSLMAGRSFSYIGAALLIRAHLLLAETNRLKPVQVEHILRIHTQATRALIDQVITDSFSIDGEGYIYSKAVDRTMDKYALEDPQ